MGRIQWYSTLVLTAICTLLSAQLKNDYNWLIGYPPNEPVDSFGGAQMVFSWDKLDVLYFETPSFLFSQSQISDDQGELLIYTEGCRIFSADHETVINGDSINYIHESFWPGCPEGGYSTFQGNLLLPWPEDETRSILIHIRIKRDFSGVELLKSQIRGLSGDVRVESRNELVTDLPGSFTEYLTAVRHANGRDWWIIVSSIRLGKAFVYHLSKNGLSFALSQSFEPQLSGTSAGQTTFSPDGSKYVYSNPFYGLDIFDFDRCAGMLSNPIHLDPLSDFNQNGAAGAAFSSNSRFLYIPNGTLLWQFDMWADDVAASKVLIDTFDGTLNPFPATFFQAKLAPNNKIYITATNGVKSLHVIHRPNEKGKACQFEQNGLHLPVHVAFTLPNMPHYTLGPIDGSRCDSLGINNLPIAKFYTYQNESDERLFEMENVSFFEPTDFYWTFGDGRASDKFEPDQLYFRSGIYEVCLTASNQFGEDTFCRNVEVNLSQEYPVPNAGEVILFPNPTNGEFALSLPELPEKVLKASFYSASGQLILTRELNADLLDHFFDLSGLPVGLYFYNVWDSEGTSQYSGGVLIAE